MNAKKKVIDNKLSVLEFAATVENESAVCHQMGVSLALFQEYSRRFQTHRIEGSRALSFIAQCLSNTIRPETIKKIKVLAMRPPRKGSNQQEVLLKAAGLQVSILNIQKIFDREDPSKRYGRLLALEKRQVEQPIELTAEQIAFIEKQNHQFREGYVESCKQGELLNM